MEKEIHILYLEDVPSEATRLESELRKSGLAFRTRRVDTREDFLRELAEPPDIILSDHGLPEFDGLTALGVAREQCPDVPFIFVTNALTREMEIEKLVGGVTDYVSKDRLEELPLAVRLALRETDKNRQRRELLAELGAQIGSIVGNRLMLPICAGCKRIRDEQSQWKAPEVYFRDLLKIQFTHGLCPDCIPKYFPGQSKLTGPSA